MSAFDAEFVDHLISGQLDLLRFEAGTRARILAVLTRMQVELTQKLASAEPLTEWNRARLQALLTQATEIIDQYFATAQGELTIAMQGAAQVIAQHTADAAVASFGVQLSVGLPTETFLGRLASNALIMGAPSAEWWGRQSASTSFNFATAVRQGVAQGETNEQIVVRVVGSPRKGVPGIMDATRSNARALVHTSIQAVANEARMETFRKNSDILAHVVWLDTLDVHTCVICAARDHKKYTLDDDPPQPIGHVMGWGGGPGAIHWGCRCVAVGVSKAYADSGLQGDRASSDGPVSANTDFAKFLKRKGKAFQDEVLGPGRAELWRDKKLTLEQLLSLDGNRLTLAQLKAKYL